MLHVHPVSVPFFSAQYSYPHFCPQRNLVEYIPMVLETSRDVCVTCYTSGIKSLSRHLPHRTAMTTLWTSTQISHPWFARSAMKRKSPTYSDDTASPTPSVKRPRRKNQSLEHDFADLTLEYAPPTPFPVSSPFATVPRPPLLFAYPPAPMPASESAQPIHDVQMSISTWYEPEKDREYTA
jgi:hypothetical protein